MENLILLCPKHHHAIHDRRWTCTGTAPNPVFARPDGQTVDRKPPVVRGDYLELVAAHGRNGIDVAVEHPGGHWAGDRIDWDCFFAAFASHLPPKAQAA